MLNPNDKPFDQTKAFFERNLFSNENSTIDQYICVENSERVVVKKSKPENQHLIAQEINIIKGLAHPHIIKYFGSCLIKSQPCIVMELMACSLQNVLIEDNILNEAKDPRAKERHLLIALGLAYGLKYLQSHKIVHCDLKPSNVLTNTDCTEVKITDFGLSTDLRDETSKPEWKKGTPRWISPEIAEIVLKGKEEPKDPYKIDIWSLGQILLQFYNNTNANPYPGMSTLLALASILAGQHAPIPPEKPLTALITSCLKKDPCDRPSPTDMIEALEKLNPDQAVETTREAKKMKLQ